MKPTKNKTYFIAFKGYHGYDAYHGRAYCVDDTADSDGWFKFKLLENGDEHNEALFSEEEIITEIKND